MLTAEHIETILELFEKKADVPHIASAIDREKIRANDYNLAVSSYVEAEDTREVINIEQLDAEIRTTVAKIDQLRRDINAVIAEIEN